MRFLWVVALILILIGMFFILHPYYGKAEYLFDKNKNPVLCIKDKINWGIKEDTTCLQITDWILLEGKPMQNEKP